MFAMAHIPGTYPAASVLFGGSVAVTNAFAKAGLRDNKPSDDTWIYEAKKMVRVKSQPLEYSWKEIPFSDKPLRNHPLARQWHQMAGLSNQKVLLFGGATQDSATLLNDTWIYNHNDSSWTQRYHLNPMGAGSNNGIQGRKYHAMASLSDSRVIVFGGVVKKGNFSNDQLASANTMLFDDSEEKENCCGWQELQMVPGGKFPKRRLSHSMAQLNAGTVLLFGGTNMISGPRYFMQDTWLFTLFTGETGGPKIQEAQWTEVQAKGAWPPGRMDHAMSSMGQNKVLLYGGCTGDQYHSSCVEFLQDLWMYTAEFEKNHGTWLQVSFVGDSGTTCGIGPGLRAKHAMAWLASSVVVFGGQINTIQGSVREATFAGDTWSLPDGCPKGHYMKIGPFGKHGLGCQKCPIGTFSNNHSLYACASCPVGLTTHRDSPPAVSQKDCTTCKGTSDNPYYPDYPTLNRGNCYAECKNDKTGRAICSPKWTCLPITWGPSCDKNCPGRIKLNLSWAKIENLNDFYASCNHHGKCNNAPDYSAAGAGTCTCNPRYAGSNCSIDCGQHGQGELFYCCCVIQLLLLLLLLFVVCCCCCCCCLF